jgi:hypothetical protein
MSNFDNILDFILSTTYADIGIEGLYNDTPAFTVVIAMVAIWMLFGSLKRTVKRLIKLALFKTLFLS